MEKFGKKVRPVWAHSWYRVHEGDEPEGEAGTREATDASNIVAREEGKYLQYKHSEDTACRGGVEWHVDVDKHHNQGQQKYAEK